MDADDPGCRDNGSPEGPVAGSSGCSVAGMDRLDDAAWASRHVAKLAERQTAAPNLLLLGDSITANYELTGPEPFRDYSDVWERYYADRRTLNLGCSGDGTRHVLWRITHGEIDAIAPKVAVVLIGTNDIGYLSLSAEAAVAGIKAVVCELHRRLPDTRILLVGVLPSDRGERIQRATMRLNDALAARYGSGEVPFVVYRDISSAFLKGGRLDVSLFSDPGQDPPEPALHPSPAGQERMAAALEPTLSRLLGDTPHGVMEQRDGLFKGT